MLGPVQLRNRSIERLETHVCTCMGEKYVPSCTYVLLLLFEIRQAYIKMHVSAPGKGSISVHLRSYTR